ncbi:MAG: hypothetical protein MPJ22_04285, partial [Pirellulales bacterium]|nr:hypothetical protein [Pirellulales bacterium]
MRLQTFFWLAAALAVAFSAINWLGLAGWLASLVIFGSLAMHIAGNAIGTRMRETTDRDLSRTHQRTSIVNGPAPSPSHLEQHSRTGWLLPISVSIGGLIGGILCAHAVSCLRSSSFLGGLLGVLSSRCTCVSFRSLGCSFICTTRTPLR